VKLIEQSVKRRVTISMIYILVALLGIIAWQKLPREFMPSLAFPQLVVLTSYANASSQEVETLITKVIEEASGTVKGVQRIHSVSREGISIVTVEFQWGTDMDFASLNLREKIDLIKVKLPREAGEPRIEKFNPFALPVVVLSLSGNRPSPELLKIARRPVAELLEKVPGVAAVSLTGGVEREILVELDQGKLANHQIPITDVVEAIRKGNVTYPAGNIKDDTYDYVVRIMGEYKRPEDIAEVIVKVDREQLLPSSAQNREMYNKGKTQTQKNTIGGVPQIKVATLGQVHDTFKERTSYARYDGQENISLAVLKQGDAHIVEVARAVEKKLKDINDKLPPGLSLKLIYDQSVFIETGIRQMVNVGLIGAWLAFLVLYIFLGSYRQALIVCIAIPTSVFATIFLLYLHGITLNTVSLAGLAVGIGLLVDGAIVVVENITRHRESGQNQTTAAIAGAKEMLGAVISSIGTTLVVFLPLIFVMGIIGQIFRDLSWAIVYSQLASLLVAFTLVPMLAGKISSNTDSRPRWQKIFLKAGNKIKTNFNYILRLAFNRPGRVLLATFIIWLISLSVLLIIPKGLFPKIDQDQFMMHLILPVGSNLDTTNVASLEIEKMLKTISGVAHQLVTVGSIPREGLQPLGVNEAQIVVELRSDRKKSSDEIIQEIKQKLRSLDLRGGKVVFKHSGSGLTALAGHDEPVVIEIKGHNLDQLKAASTNMMQALKNIPGIFNVNTSLNMNAPEIGINIKRDRAASYSLSVADLAKNVLTAVRGKIASKYREEGREIDIRVRLNESQRNNTNALHRLMIRSPLDITIPLEAVAEIIPGLGPSEILHYDQQRTVLIKASLFGRSLEAIKPQLDKNLEQLSIKFPDLSFNLSGETARINESFTSLRNILIISLVLVFMIMAALFESLWQPFLILFTIPLAMIGMGPALLLSGHTFSALAGMGLVLLCGIVVNNGIVLLDYVNQRRKKSNSLLLKDILQEACEVRVRPIVMTAATTILGLLPLALGIGKGTQMQSPMAVVVVSGLFISTILTLIILPTMVIFVEEKIFKRSTTKGTKERKEKPQKV